MGPLFTHLCSHERGGQSQHQVEGAVPAAAEGKEEEEERARTRTLAVSRSLAAAALHAGVCRVLSDQRVVVVIVVDVQRRRRVV